MSELVLNELDNGLCTLTLNRPKKLNALTLDLFKELSAHIDALAFDKVGCILLKGAEAGSRIAVARSKREGE